MRRIILIALLLAGAGIAVIIALRPGTDGLEAYPHAFIAEPGYDVTAIISIPAPLEQPPTAPDGCQIAWSCQDPAFNDAGGRPWLFPVAPSAEKPTLPLHPVLKRRPDLARCGIYRSPEAMRMLAEYRTRQKR